MCEDERAERGDGKEDRDGCGRGCAGTPNAEEDEREKDVGETKADDKEGAEEGAEDDEDEEEEEDE
jgi:hypothetical protein